MYALAGKDRLQKFPVFEAILLLYYLTFHTLSDYPLTFHTLPYCYPSTLPLSSASRLIL